MSTRRRARALPERSARCLPGGRSRPMCYRRRTMRLPPSFHRGRRPCSLSTRRGRRRFPRPIRPPSAAALAMPAPPPVDVAVAAVAAARREPARATAAAGSPRSSRPASRPTGQRRKRRRRRERPWRRARIMLLRIRAPLNELARMYELARVSCIQSCMPQRAHVLLTVHFRLRARVSWRWRRAHTHVGSFTYTVKCV